MQVQHDMTKDGGLQLNDRLASEIEALEKVRVKPGSDSETREG